MPDRSTEVHAGELGDSDPTAATRSGRPHHRSPPVPRLRSDTLTSTPTGLAGAGYRIMSPALAEFSSRAVRREGCGGCDLDAWVALDFETANGSRASACSVGLVRVEDGEVTETYSTLIRPPEGHDEFWSRNTAIHGIRSADVAGAPGWAQVWKQMDDLIAGAPVVAHNAAFDLSVIRAANTAVSLPWPTLRYACTMVLARQTWPGLPNYRLPRVAQAAGVRFSNHHRAEADALAAARILLAQQRHHGADSIDELMAAAGVRWGRLDPAGYTTCRR